MKQAGITVKNTGNCGNCGKPKNTYMPYLMMRATTQLQVIAAMQKCRVNIVI